MKKITFILFALITGTTFAQTEHTASASSPVSASIVSAIGISNSSGLDFGQILNDASGSVTITSAGGRTTSGPKLISGPAFSPATFAVNASEGFVYAVSYDTSITITNPTLAAGNKTMTVSGFNHDLNSGGNPTGAGNGQVLTVGAVLAVGADQLEGVYSGSTNVTVTYQ